MRKVFLLLGLLCCSACMARGGLLGALHTNFDAPVAGVHAAVLDVLRAEGLSIAEEAADKQVSLVKAQYADGTPVTIHTERLTDKASSCTIQVGTFGDKTRSQTLLTALSAKLGN